MYRGTLIVLALLCVAGQAHAQTAVAASSGIAFIASADHNTPGNDGQPMLTNYQGNIKAITGPNIGLFASQNLLKPTPNAQGEIVIKPLTSFGSLVNAVTYTMTVDAVGPGGASASAPSEPFCSSNRSNGAAKHWQATCSPVKK